MALPKGWIQLTPRSPSGKEKVKEGRMHDAPKTTPGQAMANCRLSRFRKPCIGKPCRSFIFTSLHISSPFPSSKKTNPRFSAGLQPFSTHLQRSFARPFRNIKPQWASLSGCFWSVETGHLFLASGWRVARLQFNPDLLDLLILINTVLRKK